MRQRKSYAKNPQLPKPEDLKSSLRGFEEAKDAILESCSKVEPVSREDRLEDQLARLLSEAPDEKRPLGSIKEEAEDICASFGVGKDDDAFENIMGYIGTRPWTESIDARRERIRDLGADGIRAKRREVGLEVGAGGNLSIEVEQTQSPEECCRRGKAFGCDLVADFYYDPDADDPDLERVSWKVRLKGIPLECPHGEFVVGGWKKIILPKLQEPVMRATKTKNKTRYTVEVQIGVQEKQSLLFQAKYHNDGSGCKTENTSDDGFYVAVPNPNRTSKDASRVALLDFLEEFGIAEREIFPDSPTGYADASKLLLDYMKESEKTTAGKGNPKDVAKAARGLRLSKPETASMRDRLYGQRGATRIPDGEDGLEKDDIKALASYLIALTDGKDQENVYFDSVTGMEEGKNTMPRTLESLRARPVKKADDLYLEEVSKGVESYLGRVMDRVFSRKYLGTPRDGLDGQSLFEGNPQEKFQEAASHFLGTPSDKGETFDDCNPLSMLSHSRKMAKNTIRGLTGESGELSRDLFHSYYGRICPIETPESDKVGIACSRALGSSLDEDGFLRAPFYRVEKGKVQKDEGIINLSVAEEYGYRRRGKEYLNVADGTNPINEDGAFIDQDRVSCRRVDRFGRIVAIEGLAAGEVDLMDAYPGQVGSVAANLIPFLAYDDATRALMATTQMKQAVPLLFPQAPLVATGLEALVADEAGAVVRARESGTVVYADAERVEVQTEGSSTIEDYILPRNEAGNKGTGQTGHPRVSLGDTVGAGDILAEGPACDGGELALGANLVAAYMPWEGYNFEDAIVVSERLVKDEVLTSVQAYSFEFDIRDEGTEICNPAEGKGFLRLDAIYGSAYAHLGKDGLPVEGTEVSPGDVLVGARKKTNTKEASSGRFKDASFLAPPTCEGTVVRAEVFAGEDAPQGVKKRVVVTVAQKRQLAVGDKLSGRHGNKGVVSLILPEEDMPYLADGTPVDILLNPLGVPSRMNIGQLYEAHMGWAAGRMARSAACGDDGGSGYIETPSFGGADAGDVLQAIKEANLLAPKRSCDLPGVGQRCCADFVQRLGYEPGSDCGKADVFDGRTGEKFPGRFAVGISYIMKLNKMAHDQISSRPSTTSGGYDALTSQPRRGRKKKGGQRFGHMEVWALMAHGAAFSLYEMASVKSDCKTSREKLRQSADPDEALACSFGGRKDALEVFKSELRALCLDFDIDNTHVEGPRCSIAIAGEGKIREWGKNGTVSRYERPKDLVGSTAPDGLSSEVIFGTGEDRRTRFGLIELAAPVVHPFYKRLVAECIGSEDYEEFDEWMKGEKVLIDMQADEFEAWLEDAKKSPVLAEADAEKQTGDGFEPGPEVRELEKQRAHLRESIEEIGRAYGPQSAEDSVGGTPRIFADGRYVLAARDVVFLFPGLKRESYLICAQIAERLLEYECGEKEKAGLEARYLDVLETLDDDGISGEDRKNLRRRAERLSILLSERCDPRDMVLRVLPVLPAGLRPSADKPGDPMPNDISVLYSNVLKANSKVGEGTATEFDKMTAEQLEKHADDNGVSLEGITEKADIAEALKQKTGKEEIDDPQVFAARLRGLQYAVGNLFGALSKQKGKPSGKRQRSISENFTGKKGRIRGNLLGRREDYSARATISVDPTLPLDECGLPEQIAFDLFAPFAIRNLIDDCGDIGHPADAEREIRNRTPRAYGALGKAMEGRRVLLNRAPTLHSLSVLAFKARLVQDETIHIPPFVCKGYNADFDGDAMAAFMPLSSPAQREAADIMAPSRNITSPAHGGVLAAPSQDCAIGLYSLTADPEPGGSGAVFPDFESALSAFCQQEGCSASEGITIRLDDKREILDGPKVDERLGRDIETTYGRVMFNGALPDGAPFVNYQVDAACMSEILSKCFAKGGPEGVVPTIERLKELGFSQAARSRLSFSIWDLGVEDPKLEEQRRKLEDQYPAESQKIEEAWKRAVETQAKDNPVRAMVESGARGSAKQAGQIMLTRGFMMNVQGERVPVAVKGNLVQGLTPSEFFITGHGAHKGVADRSYETSRPGEMTRNLVDALHDVTITCGDCGDREGEEFSRETGFEGLAGRCLAQEVTLSSGGRLEAGRFLDEGDIEAIAADGSVSSIRVRTLLTCKQEDGVCQKCYGWDVAHRKPAAIGAAVGIVAAQSIGEPGTQLTMKTFHDGGVAGQTIVGALPELQLLLRRDDKEMIALFEEETKDAGMSAQAEMPARPVETAKAVTEKIIEIYRGNKVKIDRKHAEVVARQMLGKVEVRSVAREEGAAELASRGIYPGALLDRRDMRPIAEGPDSATRGAIEIAPAFVPLRRLAESDHSFVAAASADRPVQRLADAAAIGKADGSLGMKGNHMLGSLINAGTGFGHRGRLLEGEDLAEREKEQQAQQDCMAFPILDGMLQEKDVEPVQE